MRKLVNMNNIIRSFYIVNTACVCNLAAFCNTFYSLIHFTIAVFSNYTIINSEHTFHVRVHVEDTFCDRLVAARCRWPLDRWSRLPLLWTPRPVFWLPWACLPAPSRGRRSVDGFPPPPPPPSEPPPPRRWGEKDPLVGETEPGLFRLRFCSEYQWGRLSSTDASESTSTVTALCVC